MGRPKAGEPELARDVIIDAAIETLKADGIAALSLARIAASLNVQTPALYWYFRSKADVYTYMSEKIFRDVLDSLDPELVGRDLLWAFGCAMRHKQSSIRDAAKLISMAGVSDEVRTILVPGLLARVADRDITASQARNYLTAIQSLSLGWAIFESNPATSEVMRRSGDGDIAYRDALARLVFGVVLGESPALSGTDRQEPSS